jgi:uncharacterized protein
MRIKRTESTYRVSNLPESLDGLRIAHLTDFHYCPLTPEALLRKAVHVANTSCPDLILLTGDFVNSKIEEIAPCAEIISELKAPLGVYATLGNHDYYANGPLMRRTLENHGITMLLNRNIRLPEGLWIAGLDDDLRGKPDYTAAFDGIPPGAPTVTLVHNPRMVRHFSDRSCLALAGHTHGGQVVLPFVTAMKLRQIGAEHYRAGWYNVGNVRLYVNRGLGNAGVSFRFLTPPEVALFTLEPSPA